MPLKRFLETYKLYRAIYTYRWVVVFSAVLVSFLSSMVFPIHPDELVFIQVAEHISQGESPYVAIEDNKPPGIYLLLAPVVAIVGTDMVWLRLLPFLANVTIGCLLYVICRTIYTSGEVWLVVPVWLLISPYFQSNFILTEVFMADCILMGTYLSVAGVRKNRRRVVWIGIWAAMAVYFKQTAILHVLVIGYWFVYASYKTMSLREKFNILYFYIVGLSLPSFVILFYLYKAGVLDAFWQQAVVGLFASYPPASPAELIYFLPSTLIPIVLLWVVMRLVLPEIHHKQDNYFQQRRYLLLLLLAASIPPLLFRPYHHYWIPFVAFMLPILMPTRFKPYSPD